MTKKVNEAATHEYIQRAVTTQEKFQLVSILEMQVCKMQNKET